MDFASPRPTVFGILPSGQEGITKTLKLMRQIVREYRKHPTVRELALKLTSNNRQNDTVADVKSLHAFVRDSVRYVNDTRQVETLQTPLATLELQAGDCDDKSILLASLLESIGRPARFAAVGFQPGSFSHVLVEVKFGTKWIPLETIKNVPAGWFPANVKSKMVIFV